MTSAGALPKTNKLCHPERSQAVSKANRPTESKDPVLARSATADAGNFRNAVRTIDVLAPERTLARSREAAIECSPRRKPWDSNKRSFSPEEAEENILLHVPAETSI